MRPQFRDLLGMTIMRHSFFALSLAFLLPSVGQAAQHAGGGAVSGAHFATAAPVVAPRTASGRPAAAARPATGQPARVSTRTTAVPRTTHPSGWNTGTRRNNFPFDPVFPNGDLNFSGYPVPGLGFDYPHFFATHPNARRNCRRCFGFGNGFIVPFIDGGFYLPSPVYGDHGAPPPGEESAAERPAPPEEPAGGEANSTTYSSGRTQPVPPQQEYVFVKRDGSLIFAVAYSWINDRLQYVTSEGIRRTVPRNILDLDATQQFNDQRGVPIQLHA